MNTVDKLLITILSVIVAIISLVTSLLPLAFFPQSLKDLMNTFIFHSREIAIFSVIIFAISLRLLIKIFRKRITPDYIIKENEFGKVKITFNALKELADFGIKKIEGVKNAIVNISFDNKDIIIKVAVSFYPDIVISKATKEIQEVIKFIIENNTAISIKEVFVLVDSTIIKG